MEARQGRWRWRYAQNDATGCGKIQQFDFCSIRWKCRRRRSADRRVWSKSIGGHSAWIFDWRQPEVRRDGGAEGGVASDGVVQGEERRGVDLRSFEG